MAAILCIETSSKNCSVAVFRNDEMLALKEEDGAYSHAEQLHIFIQQVLAEAGLGLNDLDAFAVSEGPGSFTGLRIGVAAVKGLCFAVQKPLLSVSTLRSMCRSIKTEPGTGDFVFCPMIDARRMEVYCALFDSSYKTIQAPQARILEQDSFKEILSAKKVYFFGDGMPKFRELTGDPEDAVYVEQVVPSAKWMGTEANEKFELGKFEDIAYYEPLYVKEVYTTTPKKQL